MSRRFVCIGVNHSSAHQHRQLVGRVGEGLFGLFERPREPSADVGDLNTVLK